MSGSTDSGDSRVAHHSSSNPVSNPKPLWFRAKRLGLGWYPVSWQGWLSIVLFVIIVLVQALSVQHNPSAAITGHAIIVIVCAAVLLCLLCYGTGERLQWRWSQR